MNEKTPTPSRRPVMHRVSSNPTVAGSSNLDWWPKQLRVDLLYGTLSNDFFISLLDMKAVWGATVASGRPVLGTRPHDWRAELDGDPRRSRLRLNSSRMQNPLPLGEHRATI